MANKEEYALALITYINLTGDLDSKETSSQTKEIHDFIIENTFEKFTAFGVLFGDIATYSESHEELIIWECKEGNSPILDNITSDSKAYNDIVDLKIFFMKGLKNINLEAINETNFYVKDYKPKALNDRVKQKEYKGIIFDEKGNKNLGEIIEIISLERNISFLQWYDAIEAYKSSVENYVVEGKNPSLKLINNVEKQAEKYNNRISGNDEFSDEIKKLENKGLVLTNEIGIEISKRFENAFLFERLSKLLNGTKDNNNTLKSSIINLFILCINSKLINNDNEAVDIIDVYEEMKKWINENYIFTIDPKKKIEIIDKIIKEIENDK